MPPINSNLLTDTLKKTFLIGLGATVLTADKVKSGVKELVDDLIARGYLNNQEGQELVEELKSRIASEKDGLEASVRTYLDQTVKKAIHSLGLVTQEELKSAIEKAKLSSAPSGSSRAGADDKPPSRYSRYEGPSRGPARGAASRPSSGRPSPAARPTSARPSSGRPAGESSGDGFDSPRPRKPAPGKKYSGSRPDSGRRSGSGAGKSPGGKPPKRGGPKPFRGK